MKFIERFRPYSLPGAVGTDDEGQRLEERDNVLILRIEAPDALDEHLVHRTHLRERAEERKRGSISSAHFRPLNRVFKASNSTEPGPRLTGPQCKPGMNLFACSPGYYLSLPSSNFED